jgi:hypothetical protein
VEVELRYQTIAYRRAQNLGGYKAAEPKRFLAFYRSMSSSSSVAMARALAEAKPDSARQTR